jgi:hypothetical protein
VQADTALRSLTGEDGTVSAQTLLKVGVRWWGHLEIWPPLDSGLQYREFYPFSPQAISNVRGLATRVSIDVDDGLVEAAIGSPSLWFAGSAGLSPTRSIGPMSLIALEDSWAFAVGDSVHLTAPGRAIKTFELNHAISEMRIWEAASQTRIGICVPDRHQILIGPTQVSVFGYLDWPFTIGSAPTAVGIKADQEPGAFFYPLSFDVGSDGRIFVLDAGNARIQAFDAEGEYITQWGSRGTGDGQFEFGDGFRPEDFAGSVAVDDEGFIYVADVGNRRIQKFAP